MSWVFYAFGAAILVSAAALVEKKALIKEHAMEFSATIAFFNFIVSLPLLFLVDFSTIQTEALWYIFGSSIVSALAFLFVSKGLRHMEVSSASPLLVMGPGITAFLAFIFIGENLKTTQVGGIFLLMAGAYVLETRSHSSLFGPLKEFIKSKYIHYILLALVFYGISALFERIILHHYAFDPFTFILIIHTFLLFNFTLLLIVFHDGINGLRHGVKVLGWGALGIAVFTVIYRFLAASAMKLAAVGLVEAVKRSSVFFTVIIGGEMFHEKNLAKKIIASVIMMAGALLVIL